MQKDVQPLREFNNDMIQAQIMTSKEWQKKLSNQQMQYKFIKASQANGQSYLSSIQIKIPNAGTDSCANDYIRVDMQFPISLSQESVGTNQYLYLIQFNNHIYYDLETSGNPLNNESKWFDSKHVVLNLPYNSACMFDHTTLSHQNVDGNKKQINVTNNQIYRQQYTQNASSAYKDLNYFEEYSNPNSIVLQKYKLTQNEAFSSSFTFQIFCKMNKLFWLWQQDFLPLFKLANPLDLTIILNRNLINNYLINKQSTLVVGNPTYSNVGCYLLMSYDTVMEKELVDKIDDRLGIPLATTQTWIKQVQSQVGTKNEYVLKVGFTCLTDIELGIFSSTDANFYKGFSTLLSENDLFFNTSPELGYNKFNLFNLNIFLNKDQLFDGDDYINCIPFFNSINYRDSGKSTSNYLLELQSDYFIKLFIRLEEFTQNYISEYNKDLINYSGIGVPANNNSRIEYNIADYNLMTSSDTLQQYTSNLPNGTKNYQFEMIYYYKQIYVIDKNGNLTKQLQQYELA